MLGAASHDAGKELLERNPEVKRQLSTGRLLQGGRVGIEEAGGLPEQRSGNVGAHGSKRIHTKHEGTAPAEGRVGGLWEGPCYQDLRGRKLATERATLCCAFPVPQTMIYAKNK